MALSIKGTPQKVEVTGTLKQVSQGQGVRRPGAVKAAQDREREREANKQRGGANGGKAR